MTKKEICNDVSKHIDALIDDVYRLEQIGERKPANYLDECIDKLYTWLKAQEKGR